MKKGYCVVLRCKVHNDWRMSEHRTLEQAEKARKRFLAGRRQAASLWEGEPYLKDEDVYIEQFDRG
jgi:hypothetical protein